MEGVIKKMKFRVMAQVPPIQAMVHIAPYHMLIAYCDDMCLWLFGDHHQGFISLSMVPCRFSISCLSYDSETEMLLSGFADPHLIPGTAFGQRNSRGAPS